MTVLDLIKSSLRLLGVYDSATTLSAEMANDAKEALNLMLSQWSNEDLAMYQVQTTEHSLSSGSAYYLIGTGQTINAARPLKIESVVYRVNNEDTKLLEVNFSEYQSIKDKTEQTETPRFYYYKPEFPYGKIYLWPASSRNFTLVISQFAKLSSFTSINDTIQLPEGYEAALKYNLAVEVAPEYGVEPKAIVYNKSVEYKANLKRTNKQSEGIAIDPLFSRMSGFGSYDIQTDEID